MHANIIVVPAGQEYTFHPLASAFPLLEGSEFAALVEDIKAHGLNEAIVLYEDKILDGRNRYRACTAAGIEPRYCEIDFGNYDAAMAHVISANIHRRHLTTEQRNELIEQLLKAKPEQSDRQIARTAKVDHKKVGAVRRKAEERGEIPHVERRTDAKGRAQPATKPKSRPPRFNAELYAINVAFSIEGLAKMLNKSPKRFDAVLDHLHADIDVIDALAALSLNPRFSALLNKAIENGGAAPVNDSIAVTEKTNITAAGNDADTAKSAESAERTTPIVTTIMPVLVTPMTSWREQTHAEK